MSRVLMDGGYAVGDTRSDAEFDLPAVLARLDGADIEAKHEAVETIVEHIDRNPDPCLATVPKLRSLLTEPNLECHEAVAYCLAELADHSPVDVAPSADEIATFVAANPGHDVTPDLLRCLEAISRKRASAISEYTDEIAVALENDDPTARAAAATIFGRIAAVSDEPLEAVDDRLEALAATDLDHTVREQAQWALDRLE